MKTLHEKILVNSAGQRILIIDNEFIDKDTTYSDKLFRADFDAVLYKNHNERLVELQLINLNPITEYPFRYKPIFCAIETSISILKGIFDGAVRGIDDYTLISQVSYINDRMGDLGFEVEPDDFKFSPTTIFTSLIRYFLTRKDNIDAPLLKFGGYFGYAYPMIELFIKHGFLSQKDFIELLHNFEQKGFLERSEIINTVHLCPNCFHSHLIFTETCPKCSSPDVSEENIIHHFPCANISPESTYINGSNLVCPKCHKKLRHIGVDYDRPLGLYTCHSCHTSFAHANMQCVCTNCGAKPPMEKLYKFYVCQETFTFAGKLMLAKLKVHETERDKVLLPLLFSYNAFIEFIKKRIDIYNSIGSEQNSVAVIRIYGDIDLDILDGFISIIQSERPTQAMTYFKQTLLIAIIGESENNISSIISEVKQFFLDLNYNVEEANYLYYDSSMLADNFIKLL